MSAAEAQQRIDRRQVAVKVCGLRQRSDAQACAAAGADFAGLNRVAASRRCIDLAQCTAVLDELRSCAAAGQAQVEPVLVYRDSPRSQILSETARLSVQWVQLHGDEPHDLALTLQASGLRVIRALPGSTAKASLLAWLDSADIVLLDGSQAGSGQPWAWAVPQDLDLQRVWLAGGLTAGNVEQALAHAAVAGVDAASGLETAGALDPEKIGQFVQRANGLGRIAEERSMGADGKFGRYGGRFVSELLVGALQELEHAWLQARQDPKFRSELADLLHHYAGRPTPLYRSPALSAAVGCEVYLKREDLLHGGAHKTNNTLGQALLAKRMGKTRLIAETGAGQHGVATAMAGALLGLPVTVYMGAKDVERQHPNVLRMQLFGAEVVPVSAGSASLKDAINEAMRQWTERIAETFYVFGTAAGPHPYPSLVREFQEVIGLEARQQILAQTGQLPAAAIACVGGGSNAIGLFAGFLADPGVALIGVEAGGHGLHTAKHGATLTLGSPGVIHGMRSILLQDEDGQVQEAHSISAGLDYPSVGPEHAHLRDSGRASYFAATDAQALDALQWLARKEGILAALESSHAVAWLLANPGRFQKDHSVILNLSGRGDKDLAHVGQALRERQQGAA